MKGDVGLRQHYVIFPIVVIGVCSVLVEYMVHNAFVFGCYVALISLWRILLHDDRSFSFMLNPIDF